jgi:SAM-dependent methyltransferase
MSRRSSFNRHLKGGIVMILPTSASLANSSVDRGTFEGFYARPAPWDIGRPQSAFIAVADRVTGPILDAGCGTGEHALFFDARGHRVIGIDFVEEAIRRARVKAAARGLAPEFLVKDATALGDWDARFGSVIDCGLFHVFSDADRRRYVEGLAHVLTPGGRLFLMCFSDAEPGDEGPRRVSRQELYESFADGWEVESVQPVQIDINPAFTEVQFSAGGPKAWFAIIRRKRSGRTGRTTG